MKTRILLLCGAAAPLFYLGALALGSLSTPGYDPLHQAVSELIAVGAPWKPAMDGLFAVCALMILFSSLGLQQLVEGTENRLAGLAARFGSWTLAGISLVGLAVLVFPMDLPGHPRSLVGLVHTACSCLMSAVSLPAVILFACWLYSKPGYRHLARYSAATAALLFAAGSAAAVVYFSNQAFLGLLERLTFFVFFQWLAILSLGLSRDLRPERAAGKSNRIFILPAGRENSAGTL